MTDNLIAAFKDEPFGNSSVNAKRDMSEWIENRILTWMLVPATPHPPEGSAESVRIFRSGRN